MSFKPRHRLEHDSVSHLVNSDPSSKVISRKRELSLDYFDIRFHKIYLPTYDLPPKNAWIALTEEIFCNVAKQKAKTDCSDFFFLLVHPPAYKRIILTRHKR